MISRVAVQNVKLTGGLFRERLEVNREYLMELDSMALLQNFYLEAGIIMPGLQVIPDPSDTRLHWGWEAPTCQLRGHFLGHWLSAASKLYASEKDIELKVKLDKIIDELARCQKLNGGEWAGSIPEKYFDRIANNMYVWSPQYTMHKTIMGLIDAYKYAQNETAAVVLKGLGKWFIRWTDEMLERNPVAIFGGEQGAMTEAWADAYIALKDEDYLTLAERYMNNVFFERLESGQDVLTDDHANASIPISHCAAKLYEATGDEKWKKYVEDFWTLAVTNRGMYATSGQNAGEFWVAPDSQAEYLGENNQEFCTVYNMVKTADYLFRFTGESRYADYIERALYNGFLAQQNPQMGTPTYFLPLSAGSKKKWGTKRNDFWCCHGTMVQAQTFYPELIYFENKDKNEIIVSQYIPSQANLSAGGTSVKVSQTTDMKSYNSQVLFDEHGGGEKSRWSLRFEVSADEQVRFTLSFRVPEWCVGKPLVMLNGEAVEAEVKNGFISLDREWKNDTVNILFNSEVRTEKLPSSELGAMVDGPIVLAGIVGEDCGINGSDPKEFLSPRCEHTYGTFVWKQNCYVTKNQPRNFAVKPLYDVVDEYYTVYFTMK
ncbi:MAG: beta-L-arabinofuranosidase domain-containing protein [Oscillospiraceae bacterium]